jgi:hypothetical protein
LREKTGGLLDRIATPKAFQRDASKTLTVARSDNHLDIAVKAPGDVRLTEVLSNEERKTKTSYYAKAGRSETSAAMDFEFVPSAGDPNTLTLMWQGAPLAKAEVSVTSPTTWQRSMSTDDKGMIKLSTPWKGRYVLESIRTDAEAAKAGANVRQIATLSFVVDQGIGWTEPAPASK